MPKRPEWPQKIMSRNSRIELAITGYTAGTTGHNWTRVVLHVAQSGHVYSVSPTRVGGSMVNKHECSQLMREVSSKMKKCKNYDEIVAPSCSSSRLLMMAYCASPQLPQYNLQYPRL